MPTALRTPAALFLLLAFAASAAAQKTPAQTSTIPWIPVEELKPPFDSSRWSTK